MEIVPGIYRVDNVTGANSYLAVAADTTLVIDTGMPGNAKKIIDYVTGLGKKPSEIGYIVLTHADIDHSGSIAELREITGARVAIHTEDAPALSGERKLKEVKGVLSPIFTLMSKIMKFRPLKPDLLLKEGDEIGGFKVIHTPGHTAGSICLYQPGRLIFAGDALRSDRKGNPRAMSKQMTADIEEAWKSARKIAELEFTILLPGHGAPVVYDASQKVRQLADSMAVY
jgi:glyoxylase-like metal-dependent hydrolase (beta-lactamase superfamily II)